MHIKKLKTEAKAASSYQFKGNKLQFKFNSSLLDTITSASTHLLEGNLAVVNQELENAKASLNKRSKAIPVLPSRVRPVGRQLKNTNPTR